jgi:hypothetical protein
MRRNFSAGLSRYQAIVEDRGECGRNEQLSGYEGDGGGNGTAQEQTLTSQLLRRRAAARHNMKSGILREKRRRQLRVAWRWRAARLVEEREEPREKKHFNAFH